MRIIFSDAHGLLLLSAQQLDTDRGAQGGGDSSDHAQRPLERFSAASLNRRGKGVPVRDGGFLHRPGPGDALRQRGRIHPPSRC